MFYIFFSNNLLIFLLGTNIKTKLRILLIFIFCGPRNILGLENFLRPRKIYLDTQNWNMTHK